MPQSNEETAEAQRAAVELAAIVRASRDAIMTLSLDGSILTWNQGAEYVYGYRSDEAIGRKFTEMFPDETPDETTWIIDEILQGRSVENLEMRRVRADGRIVDLVVTLSPIFRPDGAVDRIAAIAGDVTSLKDTQRELAASLEELRGAVYRDRLTGVGSRDMLTEHVDGLPPETRDMTLLLADVDEFRYFNQTFGQAAGDAVLRSLAATLREVIAEDDVIARTGGDEFAILSVGKGPARGEELARQITARLSRPIAVGAEMHSVSLGTGLATASQPVPALADFLLRRANIAQFEAKAAGHGAWRQYDAEMETALVARTRMEERLRHAFAAGSGLSLAFQPICLAASGAIVEVEALLRWQDPEHGAISPADFIPVAEQSGLIVALGEWVLRTACQTMADLGVDAPELRLCVNVSPRQLADPGFVDVVRAALIASGLDSERLVLEVTESVIVGSGEMLAAELDKVRALGAGLAVDDFGTGHSSLARLHELPFTTLKIDKSLIDGIGGGHGGDVIVDAVVGMAHGLSLTVVAEGVEQPHQLARLRALGCDLIQGFLLHRPLHAEDLRAAIQVQEAPV